MNCEICGRKLAGAGSQISIERSVLRVCQECSRFGTRVDRKTAAAIERASPKPGPRTFKYRQPRKEAFEEFVLVKNFGDVIRRAREGAGMSRDDLSKKLGQKESVIRRIESGEMYPTLDLTQKMERLLKISLRLKVEGETQTSAPFPNALTLGDVAVLKEGH